MPALVLASQSSARKLLLKRLGYEFETLPAALDEAAVEKRILGSARVTQRSVGRMVEELATLKARAVSELRPGVIVIGADQVLFFSGQGGGQVFGKPLTEARARAQLKSVSGRSIYLLNGICVIDSHGRERSWVHSTRMKFRRLSDKEIRDYVKTDQPLECAGSFKFESLGVGLFEKLETDDPTAIEGLPLLSLHKTLLKLQPALAR